MFSKIRSAVLALAAVATLGLGALVTTTDSADARGFGGGFQVAAAAAHIGRVPRRRRPPHRRRPSAHRPSSAPHRPSVRTSGIVRIHLHRHVHLRPHWCHRFHRFGHRHCGVHVRWPRPVIVGAVAATSYAVAPAYTARPCTCLTKEYTPDNLVVFKDLCTKEVASAPAGNTQVQLPAGPAQQ